MTAVRYDRVLGAALGASAAPAAMCGAGWSALGASSPSAWLLAFVTGALLGGLTWEPFAGDRDIGVGFCVLFGACAGLLSGALVGGPVGGVFGLCGGGSAGLAAPAVDRALQLDRTWTRGAAMLLTGGSAAALVGWGMTL